MQPSVFVFLVVIFASIFGQRYRNYFDKHGLKLRPPVAEISLGPEEDLAQLPERLTKADKWEEFISETDKLKDEYEGKVMPNWEQDRDKWAQYSRGLQDYIPSPRPRGVNPTPSPIRGIPSIGLESYWGEEDIDKELTQYKNHGAQNQDPRNMLKSAGFPQPLTGPQVKEIAMQKLSKLSNPAKGLVLNQSSRISLHLPAQITQTPAIIGRNASYDRNMPRVDDYGSPVHWVPYNSNYTDDGLAKVTDLSTGRNRQFLIDGVVFVPVIDTNILRLGYSTNAPTTETVQGITPETSAIRTVVNNVDLKSVDDRDWLAFETVLNEKHLQEQCDGDGCQSRCHKTGCESKCSGDTCASGCVGSSCTAFCKGPGCVAMCIGEQCDARCDGMSCETRCRGIKCDASCRRFSCQYTINGNIRIGSGTWDQMYPQYDTGLHRPSPGSDYIQPNTRYSPWA